MGGGEGMCTTLKQESVKKLNANGLMVDFGFLDLSYKIKRTPFIFLREKGVEVFPVSPAAEKD